MAFSLDKIGNKSLYDVSAPVDPSSVQKANAPVQEQVSGGKLTMAAAPSPDKYVADLTKILRNCSRETWRTVSTDDIAALKKKIRDLKIDSGKDKKTVAAWQGLEQDAVNFGEKLKEIQRYTVEGLAKALYEGKELYMGKAHSDDVEVEMSAAEKLIEGALNDLEELSSKLTTLSEGLQNLPDELRYEIDDMMLLCDSRASELDQLCADLVELARKTETENKVYFDSISSDPRGEGEGDDSVINLTKGMGGVMHGNLEAVENMGFGVEERIRNNSLGMVKTDGKYEKVGEVVDLKKMADLYGSTIKKKTPEATAELATKHLGQRMSQNLLAPFLEVIKANENELNVSNTINSIQQKALNAARFKFLNSLPNPFPTLAKKDFNNQEGQAGYVILKTLVHAHAECLKSMKEMTAALNSGKEPTEEAFKNPEAALKRTFKNYSVLINDLAAEESEGRTAVISVMRGLKLGRNSPEARFLSTLERLNSAIAKYQAMLKRYGNESDKAVVKARGDMVVAQKAVVSSLFGTSLESVGEDSISTWVDLLKGIDGKAAGKFLDGDVKNLFKGGKNPVLSPMALAGMYGVDMKWIDQDLTTENETGSKQLGSGNFNTVEKITYKNGKVIVFKPDVSSSIGTKLMLAGNKGFNAAIHTLKTNLSANVIANRLGLGKRVTKTTALYHGGNFGIGMSFAPGFAPGDEDETHIEKRADYVLGTMLGDTEHPEQGVIAKPAIGDLVHQTVDLQWLDLLTGQGDRHSSNYFIHWNKDDGVIVTGIDNDVCMGKDRIGLTKIQLDAEKRDYLYNSLLALVTSAPERYGLAGNLNEDDLNTAAMALVDSWLEDCLTTQESTDSTRLYVLDFSKDIPFEVLANLRDVLGVPTLAVPKVMSRSLFDTLNALRQNAKEKEAFIQEIEELMPKENVEAFKQRLEDMLDLVANHEENGLTIVEDHEWLSKKIRTAMAPKVPKMKGMVDPGMTEDEMRRLVDPSGYANYATTNFAFRDMPELMYDEFVVKAGEEVVQQQDPLVDNSEFPPWYNSVTGMNYTWDPVQGMYYDSENELHYDSTNNLYYYINPNGGPSHTYTYDPQDGLYYDASSRSYYDPNDRRTHDY